MPTYELESLPIIIAAHGFSADSYSAKFTNGSKEFIEVALVTAGSATFEYYGQEYTGVKGDIICTVRDRSPFSVRWESFHEHHTVMASVKWRMATNEMNGLYLPLIIHSQPGTRVIEDTIEQLIHNQLLFSDSPTRGAALFPNLLYEIDKFSRESKKQRLPSNMLYTQRAKEFIYKNIHLPINQKSIAAQLSISPEYLCRVFKETEGCSLKKYANTEKLKAIKALMETEHVQLHEAVTRFGYSDPNYVSRLFKKYFGYNITKKAKVGVQRV